MSTDFSTQAVYGIGAPGELKEFEEDGYPSQEKGTAQLQEWGYKHLAFFSNVSNTGDYAWVVGLPRTAVEVFEKYEHGDSLVELEAPTEEEIVELESFAARRQATGAGPHGWKILNSIY